MLALALLCGTGQHITEALNLLAQKRLHSTLYAVTVPGVACSRLRGLYVGVEPNVIETALSSGVYFYLYSRLRHFVVMHAKRPLGGQGQTGG